MGKYMTVDRCKDPNCDCLDRAGVILYRGESYEDALSAMSEAKYPDPEVVDNTRQEQQPRDDTYIKNKE